MRLQQFSEWAEKCFKYAKKKNTGLVAAYIIEDSPKFLASIRGLWTSQIPINCANMEAAVRTRSQQVTQKTVMGGVTANEVSLELSFFVPMSF